MLVFIGGTQDLKQGQPYARPRSYSPGNFWNFELEVQLCWSSAPGEQAWRRDAMRNKETRPRGQRNSIAVGHALHGEGTSWITGILYGLPA